MWTISDFPAYGKLSGWATAGKLACPHCGKYSQAFRLQNGKKIYWFDCHRRFLKSDHPFRLNKTKFTKNHTEERGPPPIMNDVEILREIEDFGFKKVGCGWKKRSIFWDFPYWKTNLISHNSDVMHIEKNFFENLFYTIMDVKDKTKDNTKARDDLKDFCNRKGFGKNQVTGQYTKAPYALSKEEKKSLLPIAFRKVLPTKVWETITEISLFFRSLTATVITVEDMKRLEAEIPVILCKLEEIFIPVFFDSMEHLPIHLPYEAKIGGRVQYRWMYPFERLLHQLKKDVRVEGSICNAFLVCKALNFRSHYFEPHVYTRIRKMPRNDDGGAEDVDEEKLSIFLHHGRPYGKLKSRRLSDKEFNALHSYILFNEEKVQPKYERLLKELYPDISEHDLMEEVDTNFASWFENYARQNQIKNKYIHDLSRRPLRTVKLYNVYFVNGYKFHTESYGANKVTMNSGVCISSDSCDYNGRLLEILEVEYPGLPIKSTVLFNCEWYDPTPNVGVKVHNQYKLVDINKHRKFRKFEPFVLAVQATQVCYIPYPSMKQNMSDWLAVCKVKPRGWIDVQNTNNNKNDDAFQDDEAEANEIISPMEEASTSSRDETVEYGDISSNASSDDNNDDNEGEFEYSSSTNEEEDGNDDMYDDDND
ncbi:hypothetical protein Lser_V15G05225 [Lactuca serriola]